MMLGVSNRLSPLARNAQLKRLVFYSASRTACIPAGKVLLSQDTKYANQLLAAATGLFAFCYIGTSSIDCTVRQNRAQLEAVATQFDVGEDLRNLADSSSSESETDDDDDEETTNVMNWSGTHVVTVKNKNYWEPESIEEVEKIIKDCHEKGQSVRPVGASLSPNGIALNADGMMSMAHLDKVVEIDKKRMTVTAQAGVTINQVRSTFLG